MNRSRLRRLVFLSSLALAACTPDPGSPISTVAVVYQPAPVAQYELTPVTLDTIYPEDGGSFIALTGSVAQIIGGAEVVIDPNDPALMAAQTEDQVQSAVLKNPGGSVNVNVVSKNGVYWPADFHSQNMVTTYYNFQRAFAFYQTLGWSDLQSGTPKVYYWVDFVEGAAGSSGLTDNAAFSTLVDGFLILPFNELQAVPLPMNLGVIGHEYSHFQINTRIPALAGMYAAWAGAGLTGVSAAANTLKSLDEGFADFFGVGVTCGTPINPADCRTNFLNDSIPEDGEPLDPTVRDVGTQHCYNTALYDQVQQDDFNDFVDGSYQYALGDVFASAMWSAATDPNLVSAVGQANAIQETMQALYDSLDVDLPVTQFQTGLSLATLLQSDLNASTAFDPIWTVANMVVAHAGSDPNLGTALCNGFMTNLGALPNTNADPSQDCSELCDPSSPNMWNGAGLPPACICACQAYPLATPGTCGS